MSASSTLSFRISPKDCKLIDRAAEAMNKSHTEFMLDGARAAAIDALLDQRLFVVDEKDFKVFEASLRKAPRARLNKKTGEVGAACNRGGIYAATNLMNDLCADPADKEFTRAVRPRNGNEVPVCQNCEESFGRDAFPPGTTFEADLH